MKRPIGTITRGTTAPNRLRRIDTWMAWRYEQLLAHTLHPLVVDLGYGRSPITTIELAQRLSHHNTALQVIGLEIDPDRVASAQGAANSQVHFALGGFEIPTPTAPILIRALNVLRQYSESDVAGYWQMMQDRLAEGGRLVEGTCDEQGRLAAWVELDGRQPLSLTLAAATPHIDRVSDIAPRLPKVLIHHNTAGHAIHHFLRDADAAWSAHAALRIFGARQRWAATLRTLRTQWPILTPPSRATHGEITIAWSAIAP